MAIQQPARDLSVREALPIDTQFIGRTGIRGWVIRGHGKGEHAVQLGSPLRQLLRRGVFDRDATGQMRRRPMASGRINSRSQPTLRDDHSVLTVLLVQGIHRRRRGQR